MKILITGGCGFIATNLIPVLHKQGHEIAIVDNLSHGTYIPAVHDLTHFFKIDIRNSSDLNAVFEKFNPDITFHFAGLVSIYDCNNNPLLAADNNIMGTINVFDAVLKFTVSKRIIFSETSAVYENVVLPEGGYKETSSDPTTVYATTKACCALLADSYARTKGLRYTALRYFNVAGPIQDYKRTVPPLFAGVALRLMGENFPIIFGDGNRRRDFIHVDDINRFHLQCITDERTINETFNLGMAKSTSIFEICEIVHEYLKLDTKLEYDMFPEINGEAFEIVANIDKAKHLGWEPKKSIKDMIVDTIEYLKLEIERGNVDPKTFMNNLDISNVKI